MPDPGALPNRDFKTTPVWWEETPPQGMPVANLAARCDVAIIGGGIAGLSAAIELARRGTQVTVLEAEEFGHQASGRNSGGISFGLDFPKIQKWARWTGGAAPDLQAYARGALDSVLHTERFIAENQLDCDYRRAGRLSCAPTPRHYEEMCGKVDGLNRLFDAGAYMVPKAEQAKEIGSDRFHGAMVIPLSAQLNPAKYVRELVRLAREAGVALHTGTVVARLSREGTGFRLYTSAGELAADAVLMAMNAHAGRLSSPDVGKRIVPVASHIIVTEPLADDLAEAIIPNRRTCADNRRMLAYFRRTPDGRRFLYGSRASPFEVSPEESTATIYRRMVASFPQLAGVRITHSWGCKVAFSFDALPHMGSIDGVHFIAGCNGNGVAMMGYLGHQTARKILEGGKSECVFDRADFPRLPLYHGSPWFLPVVAGWYRLLDHLDQSKA